MRQRGSEAATSSVTAICQPALSGGMQVVHEASGGLELFEHRLFFDNEVSQKRGYPLRPTGTYSPGAEIFYELSAARPEVVAGDG